MEMTKEVPVSVGLVLGLHLEDSHILGGRLGGRTLKGLKCVPLSNECYQKEVVSLLQHLRDLGDIGVTMGIKGGGW
jgi:hypothetical protein